ncbi:hypothetical protein BGZ63DRAFT_492075 [Mariannaea sp. PMI_226]|nr:hypothetical protein BGZ63DRAFT_492075 [Mariannaea sp. PMI_226]
MSFDNQIKVKHDQISSSELAATALAGPLVWTGADFKESQSYTLQLDKNDLLEIDNALAEFQKLGLKIDQISKNNFAIPQLARRLRASAEALHLGRGFCVIRGLDKSCFTVEESIAVYLGIANHIAEKRGMQDRKGTMLSHVVESRDWKIPAEKRHGIHTTSALPFHTDMGCDILALQVRDSADKGGSTYLSSAWTVFNDLLNREPDVLKTLLTPEWPVQISGKKSSHYLTSVFTFYEGKLLASLDPHRLGPHPSMIDSTIPSLTTAQRYALGAVSESAAQSELQLTLKKGDLLFFNNLAMLHRRDAYQDGESTSRHMVRLWLRNQRLGWTIPGSMLLPWKAAYGESKKAKTRSYPIIPAAKYPTQRYNSGSAAFLIEDRSESESETE